MFKLPKKILAIILAVMVAASIALIPASSAFADAGGFSGSSDFSSGSDWGGSSDWGSSSSYSGSSYDDDGELTPGGIAIVIVIVLVFLFLKGRGGGGGHRGGGGGGSRRSVHIQDNFDASKMMPLDQLMQRDPNLNLGSIQEQLANLYVRMQNAWTAKDFEPMRPFFQDNLYNQFARQLDALKTRGQTNYVDNIAVMSVIVKGWYQEGGQDCLVAEITARITDYTVDDRTGNVVSGDRNREKFMTYRWILSRPSGTTTQAVGAMTTVNCPNCSATLQINSTAQCPYCGSVVELAQHDWALTAIQGLKQQTL